MSSSVLVVDDDASIRESLRLFLERFGCTVTEAGSAEEALEQLSDAAPDLVISDLIMPGMSGFDLLESVKVSHPWLPFVIVTVCDEMEYTIEAIRRGAFDFLEKPLDLEKLRSIVEAASPGPYSRDSVQLQHSGEKLRRADENGPHIVGNAPLMRALYKQIGQLSDTRISVLIQGESGTGKELVARVIHESGVTHGLPFVAVNCSVLAEGLLESELFGHVKGAFTSAIRGKRGKFTLAGEGTIFLDEIGDISPSFQAKLLRVLQEHEFEQVGGEETLPMRARVIAATNRDVRRLVRDGVFREDLYYRLNVARIDVPPLRERLVDLPQLVLHFLSKIESELHRGVYKVSYETIEQLGQHSWPGNIRELENVLTKSVLSSKGSVLELVPDFQQGTTELGEGDGDMPGDAQLLSLVELEKRHIIRVLTSLRWDKTRTCAVLGISRPTLNSKIRAYGIERE